MKFHFIFTPYSWDPEKEHIKYEDDLEVPLTDKEIDLIQHSVDPASPHPFDEQLRRKLKKIYKKIVAVGYPMCQYYDCYEIRLTDLISDVAWEPVDQAQLLKEDVEKNGFNPCDESGRPYSPEELQKQWVLWEATQLSSLSYEERLTYYEERFHFGVDGILDNGMSKLNFTLPTSIDCSGPTDNWFQRKLRQHLN